MNEFAIFKRFQNADQANEFAEELKNNGIYCQLIEDSPSVDITFAGNLASQSEIQLMIRQLDFEKANTILDSVCL